MSKEKTLESAENRIMHLIRQAFLFGTRYESSETTPFENWLIDNKIVHEIDKAISIASEPEWIKCSERLPTTNGYYNIFIPHSEYGKLDEVRSGFYYSIPRIWKYNYGLLEELIEPEYWQDLPEAKPNKDILVSLNSARDIIEMVSDHISDLGVYNQLLREIDKINALLQSFTRSTN